jgi:hypothetical protein
MTLQNLFPPIFILLFFTLYFLFTFSFPFTFFFLDFLFLSTQFPQAFICYPTLSPVHQSGGVAWDGTTGAKAARTGWRRKRPWGGSRQPRRRGQSGGEAAGWGSSTPRQRD